MQPQAYEAAAMKTKHPYAVPTRLSPDLTRVGAYWEGLLRGAAAMPFWDDVKPSDLPDLTGHLFLIDVLGPPERFRFGQVGEALTPEGLAGKFLDETNLDRLFEFLQSQCDATGECAAATYFRDDGVALPYAETASAAVGRWPGFDVAGRCGRGLIARLVCESSPCSRRRGTSSEPGDIAPGPFEFNPAACLPRGRCGCDLGADQIESGRRGERGHAIDNRIRPRSILARGPAGE